MAEHNLLNERCT